MVALNGKASIGDDINKKIIGPLANANKLSDMPDFNDATKLGDGKEKVDRIINLIAIFEDKAVDFSKNRADGDDILGDACEYLMRHFATESGKSKGQFYTPAEVNRIIAQILGIREAKTTNDAMAYDPTCGSGSLLLKVTDAARTPVIDAFGCWDPWPIVAMKDVPGAVEVVRGGDTIAYLSYNVGLRPWVEKNGETIEKFLAAVSEADKWMRANPKQAAQIATRWIPA